MLVDGEVAKSHDVRVEMRWRRDRADSRLDELLVGAVVENHEIGDVTLGKKLFEKLQFLPDPVADDAVVHDPDWPPLSLREPGELRRDRVLIPLVRAEHRRSPEEEHVDGVRPRARPWLI